MPYKRINHFNEWMAQFQAKESTFVPEEISTRCVTNSKDAHSKHVGDNAQEGQGHSQKVEIQQVLQHVPQITNMLSGVSPPKMSSQLEEQLRNMFRDVEPFEKHKPKGRSNFRTGTVCISSASSDTTNFWIFPLLKSREKLYQQDRIQIDM